MRHCLLLLCCTAALCISSNADEIALQNGDRLSGTIVKSDEKELVLNTDYADTVTIKWAAVQTLSSSTPLHLQMKDGRTVTGNVTGQGGSWVVREANGETVPVSKAEVALIRSETEQTAYNQAQHPGLLQNWEGGPISDSLLPGATARARIWPSVSQRTARHSTTS